MSFTPIRRIHGRAGRPCGFEEFQSKMLAGIVAFEIDVTKLDSKFKLNQHRKEAHAAMKERYAAGSPAEQALAVWMQRLGL